MLKVLVIDIGGSKVKFAVPGSRAKRSIPTERALTPRRLLELLGSITVGWEYDVVSIGFPGPVIHGRPSLDPAKFGKGWDSFDFEKHFKKPVKIINDAAMQALGGYKGGRMLFIGLGTGLGSALILDDIIVPLELGELTDPHGRRLASILGKRGLKRRGLTGWRRSFRKIAPRLRAAFRTDYIAIGGGNAKHLGRLPRWIRRGGNHLALAGGARLWNTSVRHVKHTWILG
ncbi:MAG: ROK family protein [Verrucomicrobia bacterium]|nr:MAG: ROK family protein [Verrucomicrobiota bacterium]